MADMFEREGDDGLALQGNIAAAEEDATDLAVSNASQHSLTTEPKALVPK